MSNRPIKISAVNYWNTIPFQYAIEHHLSHNERFDISWDIPADCAQKLHDRQVDIGLIPVAFLPKVEGAHRIVDFGIAAYGPVYSVALYANVPLNQIQTIVLDYQSRTSVRLCRILCKKYWNIEPEFVAAEPGFEMKGVENTAVVVIGNRTFGLEDHYAYKWDLAEEWKNWNGLPFVFAVWAANTPISDELTKVLSDVFEWGLNHIHESIRWKAQSTELPNNIYEYLTDNIHFRIDTDKQRGMQKYLEYVRDLKL
jgi:chorismate dehydratase